MNANGCLSVVIGFLAGVVCTILVSSMSRVQVEEKQVIGDQYVILHGRAIGSTKTEIVPKEVYDRAEVGQAWYSKKMEGKEND